MVFMVRCFLNVSALLLKSIFSAWNFRKKFKLYLVTHFLIESNNNLDGFQKLAFLLVEL